MANASTGEPLPLQSAVVKWSAQTVFGTAVTPATSAGVGLARVQKRSNNIHLRGPGSANFVSRKGGSIYTDWAIQYAQAQSGIKTLLQKSVRSGGTLPYFTLGVGYEDDVTPTSNKAADQVRDCMVNTLELAFDTSSEHNPLTANLSGFGGLTTGITSLAKGTNTTTPWMSFEAVCTASASPFQVLQFRLNVNHNVSRDHVAPGAAPSSFLRGFSYLTPHDEVITGSITRYQKIGPNVLADTVPTSDLLVVFTNVDDAATLTMTLNAVDYSNEQIEHTGQGIRWSADFEAQTWGLT